MHELGSSSGGSGTLHFSPAPGSPGERKIVARATIDGVPIPDQVVAHYRFAGTVPAGVPGKVTVRRLGKALVVSWTPAVGAVRYGILVNGSGGVQQTIEVSGRRHTVRVGGFPATEGGTAGVALAARLATGGRFGQVRRSRRSRARSRSSRSRGARRSSAKVAPAAKRTRRGFRIDAHAVTSTIAPGWACAVNRVHPAASLGQEPLFPEPRAQVRFLPGRPAWLGCIGAHAGASRLMVTTDSRLFMWRITGYSSVRPLAPRT